MRSVEHPKRIIEVDLPIRRISEHARREKSIRHGHISTLHIWWARRPLAACRAVLCAALWPDPADEQCPESFREAARGWMQKWAMQYTHLLSGESQQRFFELQKNPKKLDGNETLRDALLDFIADFANWDNSTVKEFLETSRALTQAAHEALGGEPGTRPLVVDPFAGGGAIPLEALRIGADAFASDLNPVAVLLNKVILEHVPKYGKRLVDEVRKWGEWIRNQAEKELAEFYPKDPDGATPIAYLWARTIKCEGPGCGTEVPLMRSLWLARKGSRSVALRMVPDPRRKRIDFEIVENADAKDAREGTVKRGSATCPVCGYTTPVASVRTQLRARRGGAHDARLLAIREDDIQTDLRTYRLPTDRDLEATQSAARALEERKKKHKGTMSLVPDEPTPMGGGSGAGRAFSQRNYGMNLFCDLFTPREALALATLTRLANEVGKKIESGADKGLVHATQACLGLAVSRLADFCSSLCVLNVTGGRGVKNTFSRQALPIVWDFMETNPFNEVGANWDAGISALESVIDSSASPMKPAVGIELISAAEHPLPDQTAQCLATDPPYYDAVPYADLSDFFYVWLKRTVGDLYPDLFKEELTPKQDEIIVDEIKGKDKNYFETMMGKAMAEGRRILAPNGIGVVVFAHKTTAGWEAMLQAMIDAGWTITGSWPVDTERPGRLRAQESAALASSVHLVCRPRGENAETGDWREVLDQLPKRIREWMSRLVKEGVVGADAIFACLGPALEIYSRYSKVEKANGEQVLLKEYLEHVWAVVAKEALGMIFEGADATGFEEDARLTAMWLWTLSTSKNGKIEAGEEPDEEAEEETEEGNGKPAKLSGAILEYDTARKIAQGLGVHLEHLQSVVEVLKDKARLLPVKERARSLFGSKDAEPSPRRKKKAEQLAMPEILKQSKESEIEERGESPAVFKPGNTVLDRIHQAMLLFSTGRSEALKRFLVQDGMGRDPRFWRLAQALSALYPKASEEKRWVDGVLARKKGLRL
jgi:adenine-specific DNA methylase